MYQFNKNPKPVVSVPVTKDQLDNILSSASDEYIIKLYDVNKDNIESIQLLDESLERIGRKISK